MKRIMLFAFSLAFLSITSCNKNDDGPTVIVTNPTTPGLAYALSTKDFNTTYSDLRSSLQSNQNITIVAEINHKDNAQNVGQDLDNTRLIIFGNPALGTPIMQQNMLAGLDLPQKMLVYQNDDNNVFVAYNSTAYLAARHNVSAGTLQQVNSALNDIASGATNGTVSENSSGTISSNQGISTRTSLNDFTTTYNTLRNAISDNPSLSIVAEVDHQVNAQSVGMTLNPSKIIFFSNPNLGTPLMQSAQTTGIDLPQKILVWLDPADGMVKISYNRPDYLKIRHGIIGNEDIIITINNALLNLADIAAN